MAKDILRNVRLFTGGVDLTGQTNKVGWEQEFEEKDVTVFPAVDVAGVRPAKEVIAGLVGTKVTASGFWEAGDTGKVDDALWAARGGIGAWSIFPAGAAEGALAYLTQALQGSYQLGAGVGDVAPWQASMTGTLDLARGKSLSSPGVARTATGTVVLGAAVPAGRDLHASLHVLSVAGTATPTVTVAVQSASTAGFAGPTNRATFAPATARGSQYLVVPGPITDQFYRLSFTVTGTTPSFLIAAAVGID
jgi:hypothetical protein